MVLCVGGVTVGMKWGVGVNGEEEALFRQTSIHPQLPQLPPQSTPSEQTGWIETRGPILQLTALPGSPVRNSGGCFVYGIVMVTNNLFF